MLGFKPDLSDEMTEALLRDAKTEVSKKLSGIGNIEAAAWDGLTLKLQVEDECLELANLSVISSGKLLAFCVDTLYKTLILTV